jgi:CheY-like chemotaxis protein
MRNNPDSEPFYTSVGFSAMQTYSMSKPKMSSMKVPGTIVILEDIQDSLPALSLRLEQSGQIVHRLKISESAVSRTDQLRPDAILVHIGLPGTDPFTLQAALREKPNLERTRILLISAAGRESTQGNRESSFDHEFVQPIDQETVLSFLDIRATARLLLVEDHAGLAEATQEFLQSEDFEVRIASTGREALAAAIAFQPDIVLCDLHLSDMDGVDVLSALRRNPAMGGVLLVIHTASWIPPGHPLPAPEADLLLPKPIDDEKIAMLRAELQRLREEMRG